MQTFKTTSHPQLLTGPGWRVGWRLNQTYCYLLGADQWALELTSSEWEDFRTGLSFLQSEFKQIQSLLVEEETATLEYNTEAITLIGSGYPLRHRLYLRLHQHRCGEGAWAPDAVTDLIKAVDKLSWIRGLTESGE